MYDIDTDKELDELVEGIYTRNAKEYAVKGLGLAAAGTVAGLVSGTHRNFSPIDGYNYDVRGVPLPFISGNSYMLPSFAGIALPILGGFLGGAYGLIKSAYTLKKLRDEFKKAYVNELLSKKEYEQALSYVSDYAKTDDKMKIITLERNFKNLSKTIENRTKK